MQWHQVNGEALEGCPQVSQGRFLARPPMDPSLQLQFQELRLLWPQFRDFFLVLNVSSNSCLFLPQTRAIGEYSWSPVQHFFCFPAPAKSGWGKGRKPAPNGGEASAGPLPKDPTSSTTWAHWAPQRAILSRGCGTGLAFMSIWFCASLEPQEKKKKKKEILSKWTVNM